VLVAALRRNLAEWSKACAVATAEDYGWGLQTIEPAAFALLAYRRYRRLPGNLPETTGACRPVLLGQLTEP
jgi:anhydro-N-acetylmuramic acid kinase